MKIVLVEWLDAHGGNLDGWKPLKKISNLSPTPAKSVGYLVKANSKYVVICPHLVGEDEKQDGDGEISIPKSWVKKMTVLRNG